MERPNARSADWKAHPLGPELPQWVTQDAGLEARLGWTQVGFAWVKGMVTCSFQSLRCRTLSGLFPQWRGCPCPQTTLTHPTLCLLPRV